ncbi:MAG: HdeD family acid-resistance protein [Lachnospirales bacterium]
MVQGNTSKGFLIFSGLMFLILGVITFTNPAMAVLSFIWYLAAVTFFSGFASLFAYCKDKESASLFLSIIDIIFGGILLFSNVAKIMTILILPYYIAVWAIFRGILAIIISIKFRKENSKWFLFTIWGIAVIILGISFFIVPYITEIVMIKYSGLFFSIFGIGTVIKGVAMFFSKK